MTAHVVADRGFTPTCDGCSVFFGSPAPELGLCKFTPLVGWAKLYRGPKCRQRYCPSHLSFQCFGSKPAYCVHIYIFVYIYTHIYISLLYDSSGDGSPPGCLVLGYSSAHGVICVTDIRAGMDTYLSHCALSPGSNTHFLSFSPEEDVSHACGEL